jgi:hypothetical protein
MKKICYVVSLVLFLVIFGISYLNFSQTTFFVYFMNKPPVQISLSLLIFYFSVSGALASILICYPTIISLTENLKKKSRTAEKSDISSEENSDKVKMLQSKIDTLEAALKEALVSKV